MSCAVRGAPRAAPSVDLTGSALDGWNPRARDRYRGEDANRRAEAVYNGLRNGGGRQLARGERGAQVAEVQFLANWMKNNPQLAAALTGGNRAGLTALQRMRAQRDLAVDGLFGGTNRRTGRPVDRTGDMVSLMRSVVGAPRGRAITPDTFTRGPERLTTTGPPRGDLRPRPDAPRALSVEDHVRRTRTALDARGNTGLNDALAAVHRLEPGPRGQVIDGITRGTPPANVGRDALAIARSTAPDALRADMLRRMPLTPDHVSAIQDVANLPGEVRRAAVAGGIIHQLNTGEPADRSARLHTAMMQTTHGSLTEADRAHITSTVREHILSQGQDKALEHLTALTRGQPGSEQARTDAIRALLRPPGPGETHEPVWAERLGGLTGSGVSQRVRDALAPPEGTSETERIRQQIVGMRDENQRVGRIASLFTGDRATEPQRREIIEALRKDGLNDQQARAVLDRVRERGDLPPTADTSLFSALNAPPTPAERLDDFHTRLSREPGAALTDAQVRADREQVRAELARLRGPLDQEPSADYTALVKGLGERFRDHPEAMVRALAGATPEVASDVIAHAHPDDAARHLSLMLRTGIATPASTSPTAEGDRGPRRAILEHAGQLLANYGESDRAAILQALRARWNSSGAYGPQHAGELGALLRHGNLTPGLRAEVLRGVSPESLRRAVSWLRDVPPERITEPALRALSVADRNHASGRAGTNGGTLLTEAAMALAVVYALPAAAAVGLRTVGVNLLRSRPIAGAPQFGRYGSVDAAGFPRVLSGMRRPMTPERAHTYGALLRYFQRTKGPTEFRRIKEMLDGNLRRLGVNPP